MKIRFGRVHRLRLAEESTPFFTGLRGIFDRYTRMEAIAPERFSMATSLLQEMPREAEAPDFKALEDKVVRTIELLTQARHAKAEAQRDLDRLKSQLNAREERLDSLEKELLALRKDREQARERIERMITQIDNLISAETEV